ncbi:MAG TPA: hypothetical protein VGN97_01055 [Mesorhizobium sp.]|jgi:murein DD-endopeptidase MepM/ murein hydrolase activator NlpD|nr:hypothetical protein [Mesorhizobium sp.]
MALTNAEKQRRHRERLKKKLATGLDLQALAEQAVRKWNQNLAAGVQPVTVEDLIHELAAPQKVQNPGLAPLVIDFWHEFYMGALRALVPNDPWPELDRKKLNELIGDREKAAEARGLIFSWDVFTPLEWSEKITAAHHRAWLEDEKSREKARKIRERADQKRAEKEAAEKAMIRQLREERLRAKKEALAEKRAAEKAQADKEAAEKAEQERLAAERAAKQKPDYVTKQRQANPNFGRF